MRHLKIFEKFRVDNDTIVKLAGEDWEYNGDALTLRTEEVHKGDVIGGKTYSRTHVDGWTITAKIVEDEYQWINDFEAEHNAYGRVWGNFEDKIYADSEEGFKHFFKRHKPLYWDYESI